uniref:Uncharacterized protein n=1 Tax=Anopheles farauti TaxID=69004 RepID=A0A182QAL0_9DIPT
MQKKSTKKTIEVSIVVRTTVQLHASSFNSIMDKNLPNASRTLPIPTNRDLTVSLIGSIIRFAIEAPQALKRRENLSPDKLFFLLLPIVRNLGKLIDRIRHSSAVVARNASNGSGRFASSRGASSARYQSHSRLQQTPPNNGPATLLPPAPPSSTLTDTVPTTSVWQTTQKATASLNLHQQRQHQEHQEHQQHQQQQQQPFQPPCNKASMLMSDEDDESHDASEYHRDPASRAHPLRQLLRQRDGNYAIRETTDMRATDGTFQRNTKTISGPDVMILTNITSQLTELPALMPKATVGEFLERSAK